MSQFNIDEIEKRTLSGLKDFQRATVERVDYLFRHNQNRVLVADEVGMGKTLIARGAIVKTARLRIEEKDDLFKVIYICSNQNIANQNIRINLISWNGKEPKYDIRSFSPNREKCGKGITLNADEAAALLEALQKELNSGD